MIDDDVRDALHDDGDDDGARDHARVRARTGTSSSPQSVVDCQEVSLARESTLIALVVMYFIV